MVMYEICRDLVKFCLEILILAIRLRFVQTLHLIHSKLNVT